MLGCGGLDLKSLAAKAACRFQSGPGTIKQALLSGTQPVLAARVAIVVRARRLIDTAGHVTLAAVLLHGFSWAAERRMLERSELNVPARFAERAYQNDSPSAALAAGSGVRE